MNVANKSDRSQRQSGGGVLGLAFDGGRLEGAVARRANGAVEIKQTFSAPLSLDLLTDDPELVGREIRQQLETAGIRENRCVVGLPLNWALTLAVKLPELPEADIESFLQLEAERGFPYPPDALITSRSRFHDPDAELYATLVAVPRGHVTRLEAVLKAAQLRVLSLSLGITALERPRPGSPDGVLALVAGPSSVGLQVSCDGGVVVLRTVEDAYELEGGAQRIQADQVAREVRITLGQLPPAVRESVRQVRVYGATEAADELAEQLGPRIASLGIGFEQVRGYPAGGVYKLLPANTPVSPAVSLAARLLAGPGSALEFLPPKVSVWKQFAQRHSSRKLVLAGGAAGLVALVVGLAFAVQQWQLAHWRSRWSALQPRVTELEHMQQQIKQFRPWFDESFRSLSVLRRLTEAFPAEGNVTAKSVEIRNPSTVTCTGTARDHQALLKTLEQLRAAKEVSAVKVEQLRGKNPMHFSFNFQWNERGGQ